MPDILLPEHLDTLPERQFQNVVEEIAGLCGYSAAYHTRFSLGSDPGFPDLALFNPRQGGAVFLECKVKSNRPSDKQKAWLYELRCSGFHAYCAHPAWMDLIVDVLNGRYPPPMVGTGAPHPVLAPISYPPAYVTEVTP